MAVWGVSQGAPSASTTSTPWTRAEFVGAFSGLHVNACWPAERVWKARPFTTTTALRQAFEDEVLAASPEDQEVLIADYTDVVDLLLDTTSLALGEPDDAEAAELRDLSEANRATFGRPHVMCVERVRGQLIAQGWPRMEGSDDCEARTAVGKVIDIANERFSTMIANANPIHSAWARKFEQLD